MSKIQDLKGTHNLHKSLIFNLLVVSDVKDTRFERNSQHWKQTVMVTRGCFWCQRYKIWKELTTLKQNTSCMFCCFWCQRYKIWKELTTEKPDKDKFKALFLMSKIQDLKGTHNPPRWYSCSGRVVSDVKDTRFERNSQHRYQ